MKHGLGLVGFGGMAGWHTQFALKSDVVELIGVYDIKEERNKIKEMTDEEKEEMIAKRKNLQK